MHHLLLWIQKGVRNLHSSFSCVLADPLPPSLLSRVFRRVVSGELSLLLKLFFLSKAFVMEVMPVVLPLCF
jgi:hypothetical protein